MNSRKDPKSPDGGFTDLMIDQIVKPDPVLGAQQVITIPRYIEIKDPNDPTRMVVFFDVAMGKLNVNRGILVKSAALTGYIREALALNPNDRHKILAHAFNYLDHKDSDVAREAWYEFSNTAAELTGQVEHVYAALAKELSADKLARWLRDPQTPKDRLGVYGLLLGYCGTKKHADLLRAVLADEGRYPHCSLEGLVCGLTLLDANSGYDFLRKYLADRSRPFMQRYAGLQAIRFLWTWGADLVSKKQLVALLEPLLDQEDLADLVIDDFRHWQRADQADRVLALFQKQSHDQPMIRRAIIRYALTFPHHGPAAALVEKLRKQDPKLVEEQELALREERKTTPVTQ